MVQGVKVWARVGWIVFWCCVSSPLGAGLDLLNIHKEKKVTAVRIDEETIVVDGELGEQEWNLAEPARDFIQTEPRIGEPASEPTEVRLLYDRKNLYVGVYCFDSEGEKGIVVKDLRKDFFGFDGDVFQMIVDTFDDNRNGIVFSTNPKGARSDVQIGGDGTNFNRDWDGVWFVKTKITPKGWQVEVAIPFKTLRFREDENQMWGVNFARSIRRKNEQTYWSPPPRPYRIYRVSLAGTLNGITSVQQGRNFYLKPYISAPVARREKDDVDFAPDAGFDLKYGITSQLVLDLTVNTDFAQVESDEQQINLTRFSLFFPEKREFFLENSGIFQFGRSGFRGMTGGGSGGGGMGGGGGGGFTRDLLPFFSRRIGISGGELVPILGGARVTGRAGKYTLGLLTMQSDEFKDNPSTNFSVARIRRDVFRNSEVGVLFVNKDVDGGQFNRTYGADANFTFLNYLDISSYVLKTDTPGIHDHDRAGNFRISWRDQLFDVAASHLSIQENFNPEVGFVPRRGIRNTSGEFAITPRPERRIPWVREFRPSVEVDYITNQENVLETREFDGRFSIIFRNGSYLSFSRNTTFERLPKTERILNQDIPAGDYQFEEHSALFSSDRSRLLSGFLRVSSGTFYHGERDSYWFGGTVQPNAHFGANLSWSRNHLRFPTREFATDLVSARIGYSFTTNMFLNALIQYNSRQREVASNIRFNFIHKPLSDLFLVYNERRSSTGEVLERALIAKLTYVFDF